MKFRIDPQIFSQFSDLKVGAIVIKGMNNMRRNSSVESLLRGICAQRGREFQDRDILENENIKPWATAYEKFGVNPVKYPPAIAALLKRVADGKEIPHINLLVDLYNYFSLKYLLPIGGEDMDWLCGDLNLKFTEGGEPFRAIGSIDVDTAEPGEVAYIDHAGITCRYWNYRECERTKFTEKTVNALILIEDMSKMHMDKFSDILKEMQSAIIRYIGGQIEPYILNEEFYEIDLGVRGRTNANDSKVPNQEKAHYIIEKAKKGETVSPQPKKKQEWKLTDKSHYRSQIKEIVKEGLEKAYPKLATIPHIEYPASPDHGDYATNIALQITKEVGENPRAIAEKIVTSLPENNLIQKVEIAGPGFINFFITDQILHQEIDKILANGPAYGGSNIGEGKKIIVEYSSPNIAKPLGAHHLLTTVIGSSLYFILKKLGFETIAINHIGDWGTQFGKLTYAFKQWGNREEVEKDPIPELLKLYVKFHEEAEKDPNLEDMGREEFRKFEEGDSENRELWQWFVDVSMKDVQKTFDKLGHIHFDYTLGESFYEDKMEEIINLGFEKGVIEEGEEGALVIHFEDMPTVPVRKKDGATLYITRDLATIKYRVERWHPEKILYVVDTAQSLHFRQLFEAAQRLGICQDQPEHVVFGRMRMKEGKMSTRKGNVILMNDVIEEAEENSLKVIEEKNPDLQDKQKVAHAVGIGAIKYNILSQNRITDITFDWDRMLSFEGNSGPYLQYTYARAQSILRKSSTDQPPMSDPENADEITNALIRLFPKYSEQLLIAAQEYKPNILCNYVYDLAQKFNAFYNAVPVIRASTYELKDFRQKIVQATAQILKNALELLGIDVVDEM